MVRSRKLYDVIIVGASPAGCAAAIRALEQGLRTLIVDADTFPRRRGHLEWLGPLGVALCEECGLKAKVASAAGFKDLRLCSWDLKSRCDVSDAELSGWIVDRGALEKGLWEVAGRKGADTVSRARPADLNLGEDSVTVRLHDDRELRGRVLLIADGVDSPTALLANVSSAHRAEGVAARADLTFETHTGEVGLEVVIGTRRALQLATILRAAGRAHVSLVTRETQPPPETQFAEFLGAVQMADAIPTASSAKPTLSSTPAGVALDLETHIGKRCVLIGEAGGFVSAFSNETVYPGMKSGWIAADAVARALEASVPQDELLSFSAAWRAELADYLRRPNTDLTLLMPLVFNNEQMSKRVARAFLLGRSL